MDYAELVKQLRNRRVCIQNGGSDRDFHLWDDTADAIEQLTAELEYTKRQYDLAVEDLEKIGWGEWIPVTERLPESGVCVLVTDGLEVGEGWITEIINTKGHFSRWCCPTADIDVDWRPITHWMPLPSTDGLNET